MTETQERFLKLIAAHVPPERVVELHLFPSLRQGAIESGVAVVAADPPPPDGGRADGGDQLRSDAVVTGDPDALVCDPTDDAAGGPPDETDPVAVEAPRADEAAADEPDRVSATPRPPPATRFTIYTARYRLTIKGPDRGKWEASVSADADAPLVTLEAVVRGVRRRAGEGADAVRLSGDEFRAALAAPAWATPT